MLNRLQLKGIDGMDDFDPVVYFCTIPIRHTEDLEDTNLDSALAHELFMGEYEFSFTKETSEFSHKDIEARYFTSDLNLLDDNFIYNFDKFQNKHPSLSKKHRAQTLDLV